MRRKIIVYLIAIYMLFSIGAVIGILYIKDTTRELNTVIQLHQVEQLRRSLLISLQTVQSELYAVNTPFSKDLDTIVESIFILEKTASECLSCHHPPHLSTRIVHVQNLIQDYEQGLSYFITARANEQRMKHMKSESSAIGERIIFLTENMSHAASESLQKRTVETTGKIASVEKILMMTILSTLLISIIIAFNLIQSITRPMKKLLSATRSITTGKLGTTVSHKDKTEFSELAEKFNTMSRSLKKGYDGLQKEIQERRQTEEALRESEEKLKSVFNHMQDIFFRTDSHYRINWVTPSAAKILRYDSTDKLLGLDFKDLYLDSEKKDTFLRELTERGEVTNYEIEMIRKDGSIIIVSANCHFYFDKNEKVAGVQGSCRDITDLKKREEERQKIQKLESVGIMAGGIAHDFNNILTAISTNISLAKMSGNCSEGFTSILNNAEKACEHAKNLTNQLLTFSKGGKPLKRVTHIGEILRDAANFTLRGSSVQCRFTIEDDLWPVEIDTGQMTQVINNLLLNAVQAMPEGGTVEISARNVSPDISGDKYLINHKRTIRISVKDQGTGIPGEHVNKIFDPYFTTKEKGSGLGLSSTFSIIKNHKGYIDVESEMKKGSTFHIYLPAAEGELSDQKSPQEEILAGRGRILLMDDEDMIRENLGKMLHMLGYEVETAREGLEAVELYKRAKTRGFPFDVVIMDLTISCGMGGKETIKTLLEIDPEVKSIVSSGYSSDPIMADFDQYGFCGIISKPFRIEELSGLLQKVIRDREKPS